MTTLYGFSQKTINGTVSDDQGPLPGATIIIQGSSTGVTTDFDGNYSIEASEGVTTGISAYDRAHTIRTAVMPDATR